MSHLDVGGVDFRQKELAVERPESGRRIAELDEREEENNRE